MKCEKCGFVPNPGDQVCINCGAKLSVINAVVPDVEEITAKTVEKTGNNRKLIMVTIFGVVVLIIAVFVVIKIFVLKD